MFSQTIPVGKIVLSTNGSPEVSSPAALVVPRVKVRVSWKGNGVGKGHFETLQPPVIMEKSTSWRKSTQRAGYQTDSIPESPQEEKSADRKPEQKDALFVSWFLFVFFLFLGGHSFVVSSYPLDFSFQIWIACDDAS